MAAKAFDIGHYQHLLAEAHPTLIETEEENERVLKIVDSLTRLKERSVEETKLLNLLVRLVEDFEEKHYELTQATPGQVLRELLGARELQPEDLGEVFGSKEAACEVLAGRRKILLNEAERLSNLFHVPADLFTSRSGVGSW